MAKQSVYKLCINEGGSVYASIMVGYLGDGSYFIRDLSQRNDERYHIMKMRIKEDEMSGFGTHIVPPDRVSHWMTKHRPKLTHHISGSVQVSGTGIISGNFKSIKIAKGVQVIGPHSTDGGPMGVAVVWGMNNFETVHPDSISSNHIIFSSHEISDLHPKLSENASTDAYAFELFYMDKGIKEKVDANNTIRIMHPHFGLMTMRILNHSTINPAVFGVVCRKSKVGFNAPHGTVYGGGTTASHDGYHEQILIRLPFDKSDQKKFGGKKVKKLDFNPRFKLWCLVDDFFSRGF